jgi:hypothetical protein
LTVNPRSAASPAPTPFVVPTGWCHHTDPTTSLCRSDNPGIDPRKHANDFDVLEVENQQIEQLEKGGLLTIPAPSPEDLLRLTKLVVQNNHMDRPDTTASEEKLFTFLRQHINM